MKMVRIITDSTSDISPQEAEQRGIGLIPLKVIFGNETFREGIDIGMEEFYQRLTAAEQLPTTSQPSPADFLPLFEEAKAAGEGAVVILISGKLSGTVQSALIAKEMVEGGDIHIVDSGTTITALRLLVERAVSLREAGWGATEIAAELEQLRGRVGLLAIVDTLEYLYRGGRLSKTGKIAGSLLNLKPVITIEDGALRVVGKARGLNKAIKLVLEELAGERAMDKSFPAYFGYTRDSGPCERFQALAGEGDRDLLLAPRFPVGCVVGTHAGPGACVITYIRRA